MDLMYCPISINFCPSGTFFRSSNRINLTRLIHLRIDDRNYFLKPQSYCKATIFLLKAKTKFRQKKSDIRLYINLIILFLWVFHELHKKVDPDNL